MTKYNHFDALFSEAVKNLNLLQNTTACGNYPPYNIIRLDKDSVKLELAVAGFSSENLDVELADNCMIIRGSVTQQEDAEELNVEPDYIYRGISRRAFTRRFALHEYMRVRETSLKEGILTIILEMVVPEEKKPRKVEINVQ